ncbi:MAG: hypothetical protein ACI4M3_04155 [Acutalibacteraceae bacterium]
MNGKKMTAMLLAAALSLTFLTACGDNKPTSGTESKASEVSTEKGEDKESSLAENSGTDGELMLDADDLTDEQIAKFAEILFTAVQKLDVETLKMYTEKDDNVIEVLSEIAATPQYKDLWEKTVGKMIYLPKSSILLAKSPQWLFCKWYTLKAEENAEIPDSVSKLTLDEVNDFYNKYYDECPYIAAHIDDITIKPDNDETGRLVFDIEHILESVWLERISEYNYLPQYTGDNYGTYLFGDEDSLSLGYDYIATEDKIPDYKDFLAMNLDKFVEVVESVGEIKGSDTSIFYEYYEKYYKDEKNRAIIQKWLNENCVAMRDLSSVTYFYKADLDCDFPVYLIKDEEKELVKDLDIVCKSVMYEFPGRLKNDTDYLGILFYIAETMVKRGLLPKE